MSCHFLYSLNYNCWSHSVRLSACPNFCPRRYAVTKTDVALIKFHTTCNHANTTSLNSPTRCHTTRRRDNTTLPVWCCANITLHNSLSHNTLLRCHRTRNCAYSLKSGHLKNLMICKMATPSRCLDAALAYPIVSCWERGFKRQCKNNLWPIKSLLFHRQ